jgi:PAS domain S-box-containing protein
MTATVDNAVAELQQNIEELRRERDEALAERDEALEQQTATAEVLEVINASPGDLGPVFDAMLEKAMRLCEAAFGSLLIYDGERLRAAALRSVPEAFAHFLREPLAPEPGTALARVVEERQLVHWADAAMQEGYLQRAPLAVAGVELGGVRTLVGVPLVKDTRLLGIFHLYRQEMRPFTDKQIALLQNFAAQAVIAMENARLITETREALDQQTATAEVLQVINSSPGDLTPVLDAMVERAARLCEADEAAVRTFDGELLHLAAAHGSGPEVIERLRQLGPTPANGLYEPFASGARVVHIADVRETVAFRENPVARQRMEVRRIRTWLAVALHKDGVLLGVINVHRHVVRPFSDTQIGLLQSFAAQAVIAMENARLITETREALEQQTATAEVLQVINSSTGDLAPVFDAIVEKAHALCDAAYGSLQLWDGEKFRGVAMRGFSDPMVEALRRGYSPSDMPCQRLVEGESIAHCVDLAKIDSPTAQLGGVALAGIRTILYVALRKDDVLLGQIVAARQEVRPFSEKDIALVENFAAQAGIAMANARLITETREALEQQTATAEVLQVINASPGDLVPVFDAMLDKALALCGAAFGVLWTYDGEYINPAAFRGATPEYAEFLRQGGHRPSPNNAHGRMLSGEDIVHLADLADTDDYRSGYPTVVALYDLGGARTALGVALRKDQTFLGDFLIYRQEVRPFSDKQITLLQNFAAQAVVAMENARLITETREALDQQTATAEVLQVINSSPGDLAPVFDAMLEKAMRLCKAACGQVFAFDGEKFAVVAVSGLPEFANEVKEWAPFRPPPRTALDRFVNGADVVQIADVTTEAGFGSGGDHPARRLVEVGKCRTLLSAALHKDDVLLGAISVYRQEVRPFSDKQIALLQNFAAQAVIAMENARLITETREALEQQTATAEVLGVINSSPGDLAPVFDAMVEKATNLCEAACSILWERDGNQFHAVAARGVPEAYVEHARQPLRPSPENPLGRMLRGERLIISEDAAAEEIYRAGDPTRRALVDLGGARSAVQVALVKDDVLLGSLAVFRQDVRPFTDKQIALLQNFAAQAVIAMENARLLGDLRERTEDLQQSLEYQTATSDVLKAISRSSFDLQRVLETLAESAAALAQSDTVFIFRREGDVVRLVAQHAPTPAYGAVIGSLTLGADHRSTTGRALMTGEAVRITDVQKEPDYQLPQSVADNVGSTMAVPLLRDGETIGVITLARLRVEPYTDQQLELVRTFADQAVIAIENTRLLDEVRQRQAELRVTFDNMADGVAMFDRELRLTAWNRNFQELLDLPDELLAERPGFDDYIRYLTERGEFGESDPETDIARLRSHLTDHYSFERTRPDGSVIEVRNNPMPDGGVVVIYSDITERKRSEEEIRAARDAAETAYRNLQAAQANLIQAQKMAALGQLTAGIAHEIKNPLNFVNNFASLSVELLDELKEATEPAVAALDDDKRAEVDETMVMLTGNLEKIAEQGKRADNIVKSMLEHSRGVSGERREVDLNQLVEEALNLAYHGARAQDQTFNITLERDYAATLKPIELAPQEMTRVFLNLFGNGFYATTKRARENGEGSFRPSLSVATREYGNTVEVRVRDNGTGIPPEIKDKLFQPFFTTKPTGEGTGLGLSISYDIVTQQHGGTITVESEPGSFTEFTIRLPRQ